MEGKWVKNENCQVKFFKRTTKHQVLSQKTHIDADWNENDKFSPYF